MNQRTPVLRAPTMKLAKDIAIATCMCAMRRRRAEIMSHLYRHLDENPTRVVCRLLLLPLLILLVLVFVIHHLIIIRFQMRL